MSPISLSHPMWECSSQHSVHIPRLFSHSCRVAGLSQLDQQHSASSRSTMASYGSCSGAASYRHPLRRRANRSRSEAASRPYASNIPIPVFWTMSSGVTVPPQANRPRTVAIPPRPTARNCWAARRFSSPPWHLVQSTTRLMSERAVEMGRCFPLTIWWLSKQMGLPLRSWLCLPQPSQTHPCSSLSSLDRFSHSYPRWEGKSSGSLAVAITLSSRIVHESVHARSLWFDLLNPPCVVERPKRV